MEEEIKQLKKFFQTSFAKCNSLADLDGLQQNFLGRKGFLTLLFKNLVNLDVNLRGKYGKGLNQVKKSFADLLTQKKQELESKGRQEQMKSEFYDFTLPSHQDPYGSLHPISLISYELEDIFSAMGFEIMDGPHMESDYYNFEALNFPIDHPARDMQDTFYLDNNLLLRTQTSAIQIRAMEMHKPPLRVVGPGKVFRAERVDASHSPVFHQIEGIMVDRQISVANMIYFLKMVLGKIFKEEVQTRIRPGYFPFVEPGFEMEMKCLICSGKGCSACKNAGWVEILGCGLVHPNVLGKVGVDAKSYSGFAFGVGIDRLAMMRYNIADIRLLHGGDLRLAYQFSIPRGNHK
ncbi:MAG: phenylalanine--tRNA ligase subunit alpha [SAR324 cluster bacterium]|nr:phenylalanine--tRNA ligase subunit alpha [SAR324 cluster bacterium]